MDDLAIYDAATLLLGCVRDGLAATSNQAPRRAYVTMGAPAHDDCCEGQLVVWWTRQYPSGAFPDEFVGNALCGWGQTAVDFNIEVVRCAPTYDGNGNPPSVAALDAMARVTYIDARAVWSSVLCCLSSFVRPPNRWSAVVRGQTPVDPSGGCVGSLMAVTVGLIDACPCN